MSYFDPRKEAARLSAMMKEDGFAPPDIGDPHGRALARIANYIEIVRAERDHYELLSKSRTVPTEG